MLATSFSSNAFGMQKRRRKAQPCEIVRRQEKIKRLKLEARISENSKEIATLYEMASQTSDVIKKAQYQQKIEKIRLEVATDSTRKVLLEANRLIREASRKTFQSYKLNKKLKEDWRESQSRIIKEQKYNVCEQCGTKGNNFKVCGGCQTAYYCSKKCQKKNWKKHKLECVRKQTP